VYDILMQNCPGKPGIVPVSQMGAGGATRGAQRPKPLADPLEAEAIAAIKEKVKERVEKALTGWSEQYARNRQGYREKARQERAFRRNNG